MKLRKNLFKLFAFVVMLMSLLSISSVVSASDIIIIRNPNPGGVTVLSLNQVVYHIETSDDDNPIGYLVRTTNGEDEVLGTCTVIVIDRFNPNGYVLCSDQGSNNSCGTLIINITNRITGEGYVKSVSGSLRNIFSRNTRIRLNDFAF